MVKDLTKNNNQNLKPLLDAISSDHLQELNLQEGIKIRRGRAEGVLLGGNLCLISHLVGTPFMPSLKGVVLFLEEKGETLYRVDRMMTHLKMSGRIEGLAGVMLGDFLDCGIPIVGGLPVGHGLKNTTLPIGLPVLLDTDRMRLSIMESGIFS